ncbi:hypothetical protein SpCBS45565_g04900 [Spizellomyces sp. 'palustris']|nr:hypothetical protein SpCBS45565_g04900 [Spizellomyces sp. 'palustris']
MSPFTSHPLPRLLALFVLAALQASWVVAQAIPWRDHHSAFAGQKGVYFVGGRTDASQPPYVLSANGPTVPRSQQNAQWRADPSIYFLSAATASTSNLSSNLPPLFGHSCAVVEGQEVAYCTGGFRSNIGSPFPADEGIWKYDMRNGNMTRLPARLPTSNGDPTGIPAVRGFHSSVVMDDAIYMFGGLGCLYCGLRPTYGAAQTIRYDLKTGNATFVPIVGDSGPTELIGTCAVKVPGNRVLLIGGAQSRPSVSALSDQLWLFDPSSPSRTFEPLRNFTGMAPSPRWGVTCAKSPTNNIVYIQGGCDPNGIEPSDPALYTLDLSTFTWGMLGAPGTGPGARCFAAGALLNDFFIVHGGQRSRAEVSRQQPAPATTQTPPPRSTGSPVPTSSSRNGQGVPSSRSPTSPTGAPAPSPETSDWPFGFPPMRDWENGENQQWPNGFPPMRDWEGGQNAPVPWGSQLGPQEMPRVGVEGEPVGTAPGEDDDWAWRKPEWWPHGLDFPFGGPDRQQHLRRSHIRKRHLRSFYRRQLSTQPTNGMDDSGIYVFDTKRMTWAAPSTLLQNVAPPAGASPPVVQVPTSDPIATGQAESSGQATRTKVIVGVLLGAMVAIALAVGSLLVYCRRSRNKRTYASLTQEARRSGSLRIYRVRSQGSPPKPGSSEATPIPTTPGGRFLDPRRNVVIPLLAPIPTDGGSLGEGPWAAQAGPTAASSTVPMSSEQGSRAGDLQALQRGLGDISRLQLENAQLESTALPLRQESIFRKRKPQEMVQAGASGQPVAHNASAAVAAAVTGALMGSSSHGSIPPPSTPENLQNVPRGREVDLQSPTSSSSGGYVLEQQMRYMVVYPHLPRMPDEVELRPGDEVAVRKIYKDGWCRGTNLQTGQSGCFPILAVEESDEYEGQEEVEYWDSSYYGIPDPPSDSQSLKGDGASSGGGLSLNSVLLGGGDRGYGSFASEGQEEGGDEKAGGEGEGAGFPGTSHETLLGGAEAYGYGYGYGEDQILHLPHEPRQKEEKQQLL